MFKKSLLSLSLLLATSACVTTQQGVTPQQKVTTQQGGAVKSPRTELAPITSLYNYQIINSRTKAPVSVTKVAKQLRNTDVVFIGEFHSHHGSHLLQLQLLQALYAQNPNIILSMEQFTRDSQEVLNKYLAGEYGEETLLEEGNAWPHYKGSYRAIVEYAREHNIPIVAANSPAMHVRCVGQKGADIIEQFPSEQKAWSAQSLDLDNSHYKDKFLSFIKASGRSHGQTPEQQQARQMRTYAAQLLRDTTMAESIANVLANKPKAQVVHLNGSFHSDSRLGTVAVLETLKPALKSAVLSPVMVENSAKPSLKAEQYQQGEYVYLLKKMPERYIDKDKQMASIRKLIKKRMTEQCEL